MCTSRMIVCSPINNSKEKGKKTEEQIASTFRRDSKQDTIQRYHLAGITFVAVQKYQKRNSFSWKECAISVALSVGLISGAPTLGSSAYASPLEPVLPDVSVLISGPPVKDPGALLRYALPINNKAIREVQKPLEDITDSLKVAGVRALDSVERNVRQASRALDNGRGVILNGLAESKRANGEELLDKLAVGLDELQRIVEDRNRDAVAPKQKELLQYVGT